MKFVECETIGLTGHDRCLVIEYASQNVTEYAGLDLYKGDEDVMRGNLYDTSLNAIEDSGISLDLEAEGNNASASTALSKKKQARFSDARSVRADRLCISCPNLAGRRKAGISNMLELFCTTL